MLKNLIFDIGYVLLEYRWRDMFREYGLSPEEAERVGWEVFESPTWRQRLDLGEISQEEAIAEYREQFPEDFAPIEWFMRRPEQMHVYRPEVWEKAKKLKKAGYGIYLLSNYSNHLLQAHMKGLDILQTADGGIISCNVHLTKPDPAIYHKLFDTYGLVPDECLFFDDRAENVAASIDAGMPAVQITSRGKINEELTRLLAAGSPL